MSVLIWSEHVLSSSAAVMATLEDGAPIGWSVDWSYGFNQIPEK